jgi:hypothetical protein
MTSVHVANRRNGRPPSRLLRTLGNTGTAYLGPLKQAPGTYHPTVSSSRRGMMFYGHST